MKPAGPVASGDASLLLVAVSVELTVAFLDMRQFHPGHVLVIPGQHVF